MIRSKCGCCADMFYICVLVLVCVVVLDCRQHRLYIYSYTFFYKYIFDLELCVFGNSMLMKSVGERTSPWGD